VSDVSVTGRVNGRSNGNLYRLHHTRRYSPAGSRAYRLFSTTLSQVPTVRMVGDLRISKVGRRLNICLKVDRVDQYR